MALPTATYEALAQTIKSSRILSSMLMPIARWNANAAGYRQLGLKYDDIIMEESPVVQEALRRLPREVLADRTYRHRRAFQLSLSHSVLPKEQWTKAEEDKPYLTPYIDMVEKEFAEKAKYDNLVVKQ
ncbi:cytochrome b-c1 complex subunit 7 [Catenaria anguillulae PL171]|uniref:Cytochrome b-c1 complex subunit 7 n=1 Tax=Catenaria anguillulae PL171 TaxID=765915 RepID=A0A1Y2H7U5_9FUNG|nr:cytochrome b-c1 complex subunit 7 [Catenaria anguillulae PL171]ORZ33857.1 cytochrome b-c1 complex subunit 7 [Catenaria anguillulae PL171]